MKHRDQSREARFKVLVLRCWCWCIVAVLCLLVLVLVLGLACLLSHLLAIAVVMVGASIIAHSLTEQ